MNRLKYLRKEKGLFQSDVAKIIGVTTSAYSNYEIGKRDMSTDIVIKLSSFFDVSADYLLGISNERTPTNNDETFVAFYEGYKDLDEEDKEIIKATIKALKKKNKKS